MKHINPLYSVLILLMLFAFSAKAQQVKITNLLQPNAVTAPGTNQDIVIEFKNNSAITFNSVDFAVSLNGLPTATNTWTGSLSPTSKTNFNITTIIIPVLTSDLVVSVTGINGVALPDDTAFFFIHADGVFSLPYVEDFEGTISWGSSGSNFSSGYNQDSWQLGVPGNGTITPTIPGSKAWVIGIDSDYAANIRTYLYSPVFDFAATGVGSIWMHYTINASIEPFFDSVFVEYSTDLITWTQLSTTITTGSTGGWTGMGAGLSMLASEPQVQVRFVFKSDVNIGNDGVAIDDFEILPCVISMINMNQLTPISCAGACDGVLEALPQVGYPPFTYLWSTGETTQSISNVCALNYDVTVTDVNGCTGSTGITVNQPTPIIFNLGPDVSICMGDSVVLCPNVTGGTPPYIYSWNTGPTSSCMTAFMTGVYTLTVTDANGCTATDDITITVNPLPVVILGPDALICDGASIMLNAASIGATYQWSTGEVTQTIIVSTGGTYTVTVTNMFGCTGSDDVVITQSTPIVVTPHDFYDCITFVDSVYIDVTGGAGPPYIYNWSGGTTNNVNFVNNLAPGVYSVIVTDMNGCTGSASFTTYGSLHLLINKTDPECFGYTGTIAADFNGIPPLTYLWSNGVTVPQLVNANAGTYTVTVTDANGCSLSVTDSLVEPEQIILTLDSVIASGCGGSDGSFYYSFTPPGFSIPWINGVQFATSINLSKGAYNIYIVQNVCASNTLQVVVPDSCEDVWPGDANYDLVADNKDLLQIGLAYGNTGPVRPSASNTWIAQSCTDWSNWFNIGVNQKHADCDGNGVIDAADTIPILLNYGLTHLLKTGIIQQTNTVAPDLYLVITQDTTGLSDSIFVNVMCGTAANPVDSIYGLAFRLYYDSALVDTSSIYFDYSNSFLGTAGVNLISINKNFGVGYADFAITRTDHINASGHGPVAVMGIVTTDNVAGKMLNPVNTTLQFSLSDVYAVTANEFPITLDVFGDSIFIDSTMTGINYLNWNAAVKVYPNPANNYFVVASSLINISKITILNQLGETVYKNEKPRMPQRINVSNINNGVYILRIETKEGVMHKKIQIIK